MGASERNLSVEWMVRASSDATSSSLLTLSRRVPELQLNLGAIENPRNADPMRRRGKGLGSDERKKREKTALHSLGQKARADGRIATAREDVLHVAEGNARL